MHPIRTFELRLTPAAKGNDSAGKVKEEIKHWLQNAGVESYVEGCIDGLDIPDEYGLQERDWFAEFDLDSGPVSVFRYDLESLEDLRVRAAAFFGNAVQVDITSMETKIWLEGWKESFRPFSTRRFYVEPPWTKEPCPEGRIRVVIEPGMAFGTGQHATTQLCLRALETLADEPELANSLTSLRLLDVGAGTGILAIAARKLGIPTVMATDIDPDALLAMHENMKLNGVEAAVQKGSVPADGPGYHIVLANILAVVLEKILPELAAAALPGGHVVLSGILAEDRELFTELGAKQGLTLLRGDELNGWICMHYRKGG